MANAFHVKRAVHRVIVGAAVCARLPEHQLIFHCSTKLYLRLCDDCVGPRPYKHIRVSSFISLQDVRWLARTVRGRSHCRPSHIAFCGSCTFL